jgi:hypothetical protein
MLSSTPFAVLLPHPTRNTKSIVSTPHTDEGSLNIPIMAYVGVA